MATSRNATSALERRADECRAGETRPSSVVVPRFGSMLGPCIVVRRTVKVLAPLAVTLGLLVAAVRRFAVDFGGPGLVATQRRPRPDRLRLVRQSQPRHPRLDAGRRRQRPDLDQGHLLRLRPELRRRRLRPDPGLRRARAAEVHALALDPRAAVARPVQATCSPRAATSASPPRTASGPAATAASTSTSGTAATWCAPPARPNGIWDGRWHNVTATWDGSNARLYLDGKSLGETPPRRRHRLRVAGRRHHLVRRLPRQLRPVVQRRHRPGHDVRQGAPGRADLAALGLHPQQARRSSRARARRRPSDPPAPLRPRRPRPRGPAGSGG